jgi:hypothetical protein
MRAWPLIALAIFAGVVGDALAVQSVDVKTLLLTKQDVGPTFSVNRGITIRWTLAERSDGLNSALRREFAAKWLAGAQTGFDSRREGSVMSTADLFRTSNLGSVTAGMEKIFVRFGKGVRLKSPEGAPGNDRFLMRGRMLSNGTKLEVLLYQWRENKAVLSAWLIARPGVPSVSRLMVLARRQDRKAAAS